MKLFFRRLLPVVILPMFMCAKCPGSRNSAALYADFKREQIAALLDNVVDWQTANFRYSGSGSPGRLHDHGIDAWTNATLYQGMLRWAETAPEPDKYFDWLMDIGERNGWAMPANFSSHSYGLHHADELCVGRFYLGMYERYRRPEMLAGVRNRIGAIMADPPNPDMTAWVKQSWTWCDALFMAPPVYAMLAAIEQDDKYLVFMDTLFRRTCNHLYNEDDGLFFRDDTYFDKKEANGENVYWGRGNGWVAAGLANTLRAIPEDSEHRPYYEELFRKFIPRLTSLQDGDGYWHASLLDPDSYPAPEISATALITYAIAFGINDGLLDGRNYAPAVAKGWKAITETVDADGKVGWIQPIGANPQSVDRESTAVYGVGAVLMAGAEIYEMIGRFAD